MAYIRDLDELPSAIIMTATRAIAKYDMLAAFLMPWVIEFKKLEQKT